MPPDFSSDIARATVMALPLPKAFTILHSIGLPVKFLLQALVYSPNIIGFVFECFRDI